MKKIIIANWKMNPQRLVEARILAQSSEQIAARCRGIDVVIAPPTPFLIPLGELLHRARLGAQNVFWEPSGAYTGETSWRQLKDIGVSHVIVGHSERKTHTGESNEMVAKKICAVAQHGMEAVLCIGEPERAGNDIPAVVGDQLTAAVSGLKKNFLKNIIVCYEPVWAISAVPGSRAASPDSAFRASVYIRKILVSLYGASAGSRARIIYGGSVTSANIGPFLREGHMDGALVGSASLDAKEFHSLLTAAA